MTKYWILYQTTEASLSKRGLRVPEDMVWMRHKSLANRSGEAIYHARTFTTILVRISLALWKPYYQVVLVPSPLPLQARSKDGPFHLSTWCTQFGLASINIFTRSNEPILNAVPITDAIGSFRQSHCGVVSAKSHCPLADGKTSSRDRYGPDVAFEE